MATEKVQRAEVRKAFRHAKRLMARSTVLLDSGDLLNAFAAAEAAQGAAFDAKFLISHGGAYDEAANEPEILR